MSKTHPAQGKSGFLMRLLRDQRAATMPLMAASFIPLVGLVGGAVDMSRVYLAKARLQQACDAGALAGRRRMGGGQWNQASFAPKTVAERFFDTNFADGAYGTEELEREYEEAGGRVTGTASVEVPMTLMKVFNYDQIDLEVACDAEMRLPNTDIMFVLDTTGSMEQLIPGDSQSKIAGLRTAVNCFYEIVARLDTNVACNTGTPGGGTTADTQIRFGFVPYATNVNVGGSLPPEHMADEWTYQTRVANFNTGIDIENVNSENAVWQTFMRDGAIRSMSEDDCARYGRNEQFTNEHDGNRVFTPNPAGNPVETGTRPNIVRTSYSNDPNDDRDWGYVGAPDRSGNSRSCRRRVTTRSITITRRFQFTNWTYRPDAIDVSAYKLRGPVNFANDVCVEDEDGDCTNESFIPGTVSAAGSYDERQLATMPGTQGIPLIARTWDGCIEERATVKASSYYPVPSNAHDLDIDRVPSSTAGTRWGPTLNRVVYGRGNDDAWDVEDYRRAEQTTKRNLSWPSYTCATAARRLQAWPTAAAFTNYVTNLDTGGNTYHDIGLIWGARFLSPTGIFGAANAQTPQGGEIERHLIFMTDGETCTSPANYAAYGLPWFDRRQTSDSTAPSGDNGCNGSNDTSQQVNARFSAVCSEVKNKNITLWVVYFGTTDAATVTRMRNCATSGRFFNAQNSAQLQSTFASIANQISQLRLTN